MLLLYTVENNRLVIENVDGENANSSVADWLYIGLHLRTSGKWVSNETDGMQTAKPADVSRIVVHMVEAAGKTASVNNGFYVVTSR